MTLGDTLLNGAVFLTLTAGGIAGTVAAIESMEESARKNQMVIEGRVTDDCSADTYVLQTDDNRNYVVRYESSWKPKINKNIKIIAHPGGNYVPWLGLVSEDFKRCPVKREEGQYLDNLPVLVEDSIEYLD